MPLPGAGRLALDWQPLRQLAFLVVGLLGLCMVADASALYADIQVYNAADAMMHGGWEAIADDELGDAEGGYVRAGIFQIGSMVLAGIVFLMWFRRTRLNAERLAPDGHRLRRGWVIGAWFVPVVNLWFPKKIANDICRASAPGGSSPAAGPPAPPGFVQAWWGLWLAMLFLGRGTTSTYAKAEDFAAVKSAMVMTIGYEVLAMMSALAAMVFVLRLTAMQEARLAQDDRLATGPARAVGAVTPHA